MFTPKNRALNFVCESKSNETKERESKTRILHPSLKVIDVTTRPR